MNDFLKEIEEKHEICKIQGACVHPGYYDADTGTCPVVKLARALDKISLWTIDPESAELAERTLKEVAGD